MYIEIGTATYEGDQIKSVSWRSESDQTMQTLPIREVDIVIEDKDHSESWFEGVTIKTRPTSPSNRPSATMTVYDVTVLAPAIYEIKAKSSTIADLDAVELPGQYIAIGRHWEQIIKDVFRAVYPGLSDSNLPLSMGQSAYDVFSAIPQYYWIGYMPPQTARERLRQICQALGLVVGVAGDGDVIINAAADNQYDSLYSRQITFRGANLTNTCKGARKIKKETPSAIKYTTYSNWTRTAIEGYKRIQIGETDDFPDPEPIYAWVQTVEHTITGNGNGSPVTIDNNYFINESNYQIIEYMSVPYFRKNEYELEIIDLPKRSSNRHYLSGVITAGEACSINLEDHLQYRGIVKSAEYTFGTTTRERIVISANNEPVCEMLKCTFRGVYKNGSNERLLWEYDYWLSPESMMDGYDKYFENPTIEIYVAGRLERFIPNSAYSHISLYSGSSEEYRTATAYYTRANDPG